jgi:hypothetical protein
MLKRVFEKPGHRSGRDFELVVVVEPLLVPVEVEPALVVLAVDAGERLRARGATRDRPRSPPPSAAFTACTVSVAVAALAWVMIWCCRGSEADGAGRLLHEDAVPDAHLALEQRVLRAVGSTVPRVLLEGAQHRARRCS